MSAPAPPGGPVSTEASLGLAKVRVKIPVSKGADIPLAAFINVFHRWIQKSRIEGLLVDVAEYTHVHEGPGVLLIAHEMDYSVDETGGVRGFQFASKRPPPRGAADHLKAALTGAARGAAQLESEPEFAGRLVFDPNVLYVSVADRLHAPNEPEPRRVLSEMVESVLRRVYLEVRLYPEEDPKKLAGFRVEGKGFAGVKDLLAKAEQL